MNKNVNKDLDVAINVVAKALLSMKTTLAMHKGQISQEDEAAINNDVICLNRTGQLLTYLRGDESSQVNPNTTVH